jgi:hypothetical protein
MVRMTHLDWIRDQPCCVPRCLREPIEAHHVRTAANSGTALKPDDMEVIPLCAYHHRLVHRMGQKTFQSFFGVDFSEVKEWCRKASGTVMP